MAVVGEFGVPAEAFRLGEVFGGFPPDSVELERVVPVDPAVMPEVWVADVDPEEALGRLRAHALVTDVTELARPGDRVLFRLDWEPERGGLVESLADHDTEVLAGTGGETGWSFRIRFPTQGAVRAFHRDCTADGIDLTLHRLDGPWAPDSRELLTEAQREAVLLAHEEGYWRVPRETDLVALSERLDISDTAVSQRLRRGVERLVEDGVVPARDRQ